MAHVAKLLPPHLRLEQRNLDPQEELGPLKLLNLVSVRHHTFLLVGANADLKTCWDRNLPALREKQGVLSWGTGGLIWSVSLSGMELARTDEACGARNV